MPPTAQPLVVIVVLNWNGRADTLACLRSLSRCSYPNARILAVDNGSADGSEEAVRGAFPDLPLLQTGANLGFAGGNNVGIAWALEQGADWVLLLNNDTEVEPGLLTAMMERARRDAGVGVVGASIEYFDSPGRLWAYGGGRFNLASGRVRHIQRVVGDEQLLTRGHVHFYVTGCAMLLRRDLLERVGALDTSYFHFCEDADLCLRAEQAGYTIAVAAEARLRHKVSATTRVSSPAFLYYNLRSRLRLVQRFGPPGSPGALAFTLLWMRLWRPALQSGMGRSGWRALRRAWRDFQTGAQGPAPADLATRTARARVASTRALGVALLSAALAAGAAPAGRAAQGALAAQAAGTPSPAPAAVARDARGHDDLGAHVRALWGGEGAPRQLEELLWRIALDSAREQQVLARADSTHRALTDTLLATLRWTEPHARAALPELYVVRDGGPPPGERPPAWADVRRAGLRLLRGVALDPSNGRDAALLRRLDPLDASGRPTPSEIAGQIELWVAWWAERGLDARYYLDPSRIPDVRLWLAALRAPALRAAAPDAAPSRGGPLRSLLGPLAADPLRRRALLAQLSAQTDAQLVAEAMAVLRMYQDDFVSAGLPAARWDPKLGKLAGYHADELRGVAAEVLDRTSGYIVSGANADEENLDYLRWWQRARFEARFYRDPHAAPSLAAFLDGLDRAASNGGRPLHRFLRDAYVAVGFRDLLLDRWQQTRGPGCVAELVAWLRKDRPDAVAAGFDFVWRRVPLRPLPGDQGQLTSIDWEEVRTLIRELLRRATGGAGLPETGVELRVRDEYWYRWWDEHRREPRWYRAGAQVEQTPSFAPERGRAR
jgi:GT2 family glycosyltransferase